MFPEVLTEFLKVDRVPASRHVPRLIPKPATISNSLFDDERSLLEELQDVIGGDHDENLANTSSTTGQNGKILNS